MSKHGRRRKYLLPPPVETVLLYAADGLAKQRGYLSRSGKPRTPSRDQWVPMFRQLVDSKEGLATLHDLAVIGMRAWNGSSDLVRCLDDAFQDITFRVRAISSLEHLAATAREKVILPAAPAQPPSSPPQPQQRRPAAPHPQPPKLDDTTPGRPRPGEAPRGRPPAPS